MLGSSSPVGRFFLQVLMWLPITFMIWFYMAIVATWPVTWLTDMLLPLLMPDTVSGIEQSGYMLDIATRFALPSYQGMHIPEGQVAEILVTVNPLMYGFGVPLFTALLLASPEDDESEKWLLWLLAMAVLIPVQAFGVSMDALKTMLFNMGPEVAAQLPLSGWQLEAVALGYQLGYLVLPAVTPIALWIGFHRRYIEQLAPGLLARLS